MTSSPAQLSSAFEETSSFKRKSAPSETSINGASPHNDGDSFSVGVVGGESRRRSQSLEETSKPASATTSAAAPAAASAAATTPPTFVTTANTAAKQEAQEDSGPRHLSLRMRGKSVLPKTAEITEDQSKRIDATAAIWSIEQSSSNQVFREFKGTGPAVLVSSLFALPYRLQFLHRRYLNVSLPHCLSPPLPISCFFSNLLALTEQVMRLSSDSWCGSESSINDEGISPLKGEELALRLRKQQQLAISIGAPQQLVVRVPSAAKAKDGKVLYTITCQLDGVEWNVTRREKVGAMAGRQAALSSLASFWWCPLHTPHPLHRTQRNSMRRSRRL